MAIRFYYFQKGASQINNILILYEVGRVKNLIGKFRKKMYVHVTP
jgi:hypothetical protein